MPDFPITGTWWLDGPALVAAYVLGGTVTVRLWMPHVARNLRGSHTFGSKKYWKEIKAAKATIFSMWLFAVIGVLSYFLVKGPAKALSNFMEAPVHKDAARKKELEQAIKFWLDEGNRFMDEGNTESAKMAVELAQANQDALNRFKTGQE